MFQIIRSVVLLSVLIFLPVIAVCWNMLPKDVFQKKEKTDSVSVAQNNPDNIKNTAFNEQPNKTKTPENRKNIKNNDSESVWLESSIPLRVDPLISGSLPDDSPSDKINVAGSSANNRVLNSPTTLPSNSSSSSNSPSNSQPDQLSVGSDFVRFMPMTPLPSLSNSPSSASGGGSIVVSGQRDFSEIVKELQQLGATYYCLEKWGNQGELFRFRCYVNPQNNTADNTGNQPNNSKYQRFFQHIGNDQIRVMEHVIGEIKNWKSSQ
ncbi:MAG: hypothetical protein LBT09_05275 [Planctomycetaceae bacterium]|jgi:hypothetical protein|nr:hypothetical protein [Planctomycetaceae bacterium]